MPQPESMDFSAQMPYQSSDAAPFANGDENDTWKNRKPGGLEKHERTIRLLAIIIGCLLAVFLIVAGLHLFTNKTDDNPQDNSSEVVNPGESEHSQGKKPITFH
ncbi:MAG: hypothetical protein IKG55_10410 [Solobacterium sp.]|nr:hypothetical protein [Solobacterium sp.]